MARDFKIDRGHSKNRAVSSRAVYNEQAIREEEEAEEQQPSTSKREARRRAKSKAKAERLFEKQFKGSAASSSEGSPRAAVYQTKMGRSHKKATRMQGGKPKLSLPAIPVPDLPDPAEAKERAAVALSTTSITPRFVKIITVVACLVFACLFLYQPAQQYYHAQREHARLELERDTVEQRNDALDVQNDILTSDAGMEDAVRQRYGYVRKGEEMAIVTGLSEETTDTSRDSEDIEANVLSSSVKAPEEWYTPLLDAIFGVE